MLITLCGCSDDSRCWTIKKINGTEIKVTANRIWKNEDLSVDIKNWNGPPLGLGYYFTIGRIDSVLSYTSIEGPCPCEITTKKESM